MPARIVILNGKQAGQAVALHPRGDNTIGRDPDCVVVLEDPACSRVHANVWHEEQTWRAQDMDSANGSSVNGENITTIEIRDGDKLLIGSTWLRFLNIEPAAETIEAAPATWILEESIDPETSISAFSNDGGGAMRRRELDCLESVSKVIANENDPRQLVRHVLQILTEQLDAAGAKLLLRPGPDCFEAHTPGPEPELPDAMLRQALVTTEAVLVPIAVARGARIRSIFAPLKYLNQVDGVLWVYQYPDGAPLGHEELCLVASIAHLLAPPLKMLIDVQQLQRKHDSLAAATSVQVVAGTDSMRQVLNIVSKVADVDQTVLLRAESGAGKEVVARLIHETGRRRDHPMVCVNCAALTESLLESELFGHERGAFTGATDKRQGKFEIADHGTLFLDELGSMSLATQAKVLRVLDGHPFERVGGHTPISTDVRVIAATHADLETMVAEHRFREDLYHRLRVIEIRIPPLRDRRDDIPALAEHFLAGFSEKTGRRLAFEPAALELLRAGDWPGNVRQLRNAVEQAAILSSGPLISAGSLQNMTATRDSPAAGVQSISDTTREAIERALNSSPNVPAAAEKLGMSRSALYRHMKKLAIAPPRTR